ncbi:MAG: hypothetical protein NTX54_01090 [Chloroflexi bacterium]|nr:hypothetical protein [Chloroflexota bacterium]
MRSNTGVIGAERLTAPSGATGVHGLADHYDNVKAGTWPAGTAWATVVPSVAACNEGDTVVFTVNAYSPTGQTTLWWAMIITVQGVMTPGDFTSSTYAGSVAMTPGPYGSLTGTVSRTWTNDVLTEGTEVFAMTISLTNGGPVIATSTNVAVVDTSLTPVATVTGTPSSLNEGSAATYTVTIVSGLAAGATVYWVMRTTTGTALAADFTDNTLSGSYIVSAGLVDTVTRTWANDVTTEGSEIWVMDVRIGSITGTLIGTSSPATTVADTSVSSAVYVPLVGTKAPVYGANGGAYPPTASWSGLFNSNADDANIAITIPSFTIASTAYTTAYVGSNTYITFGTGSNNYSSLGASNPAYPKIMIGASDNSYQRLSSLASGTDFVRIRYEGNASTSGTAGSPNIVYEATFFDPAKTGGLPTVEVLFGAHGRASGITMIASASTSYVTFTIVANQSYVFVGNATGTSWTVYTGYYVSNTGY